MPTASNMVGWNENRPCCKLVEDKVLKTYKEWFRLHKTSVETEEKQGNLFDWIPLDTACNQQGE
jgi:hypothetical protein